MLAFLLFVALIGPYFTFVDNQLVPEKHRWNEQNRLELPPYPPSELNWLGSDQSGVDNLSKLIMGTKETIFIIFAVTFIRYMIAIPLGVLAYKKKGVAHLAVSSLNQIFSFLPTIFSAIIIMNIPFLLFTPHRLAWVIVLLAMIEAGRAAYVIQEQTHMLSRETYIEAANVLGLSPFRRFKGYYLPSLGPEILINFCVDLGKVALLLGQLGVLSIFISHNWSTVAAYTNSFVNTSLNWITLLAQHRNDIYVSRFGFVFFPALGILFTILTFNVLGEGLRKHYNRNLRSLI